VLAQEEEEEKEEEEELSFCFNVVIALWTT
jgi:hypothetical protein